MIWDSFIQKKGVGTFSTHLRGKKIWNTATIDYFQNKNSPCGGNRTRKKDSHFFLKPSLAAPKIEVSNDKIEFFNHPVETD